MSLFDDAKRDAEDLAKLVNENATVNTRYGTNPKQSFLAKQAENDAEFQSALTGYQAQITSELQTVKESRGFRVVGAFSSGFTYELPNDVGEYNDGLGNPDSITHWIYSDADALPFNVTAGTVPSSPTYTQVAFNDLQGIVNLDEPSLLDTVYTRRYSEPDSVITADLQAGLRVKTQSRYAGWAAQNIPPRGGAEYQIVTPSEYTSIRSQATSVVGSLDFLMNNGNYLLNVESEFNLYHFGGVADWISGTATDNTSALASALTYAIETGTELDFKNYDDGAFYQASPIDLTSVTPSDKSIFLTITGDKLRTDTPSWVMSDVADVGVDLPATLGVNLDKISLTTNGDGRTSITGKVGIRSATATSSFRFNHNYVSVSEFSGAGFEYHDCILCDVKGGNIVNNKIGYKFDLTFWVGLASTTLNWRGTYVINNDVGIDANKVSESLFMGVVFENNRIGMLNRSGIKNTFIGCYGENNTEFAYYDASGASAAFVNCFSKTAGDGFVCTGDTGSYGFDRIGSGYYDDRFTKTQKINFYDRSGNDAEGISAQNVTGEMQLIESDGTKKGLIPTSRTKGIAGESRRNTVNFMVRDGVLQGSQYLPNGWSIVKNGTGDYSVDFGGAIRPPFFQVTSSPLSGLSGAGALKIDHHVQIIDSGGSWSSFSNANGVKVLTSESGTPTDACLFFSFEIEIE